MTGQTGGKEPKYKTILIFILLLILWLMFILGILGYYPLGKYPKPIDTKTEQPAKDAGTNSFGN